jgi:hypothetical protein
MQILFETRMTSGQYVSERGWRTARLSSCPLHPQGGCGFRGHGSYERKTPPGLRIARWYCAEGQVTFSLLPDFMAASFVGVLGEVERAARVAEETANVAAAAQQLRPELDDQRSAARWLRRRLSALRRGLSSLVTSVPELFGVAATLSAVATKLRAEAGRVLEVARSVAMPLLAVMATPLGFRHRSPTLESSAVALQHAMGPAPG